MQTHLQENNKESQQHLEKNAKKFSQQCLKVLELLYQGKRLTTTNAPSYGILSLPRRIKDLKDRNGITCIEEAWIKDDKGREIQKEWFINFKVQGKKDVLKKWREHLDKGTQAFTQLSLLDQENINS